MKEIERNKRLITLLGKLYDDKEAVELLGTMLINDTPAMRKTYEIMTTDNYITSRFSMGVGKGKKDG